MKPKTAICAGLLAVLGLAGCEEQRTFDRTTAEYTTVEGKRIEVRVQSTGVANEYRLLAVRDTIVIDADTDNERRRGMMAAKPFMKRTCKGATIEVLEERLVDNINYFVRFKCVAWTTARSGDTPRRPSPVPA